MEKRIFGRTDGIRAKVGEEPLVPKTVRRLGGAISKYFNNGRIIIGRDTRESGDWILEELEAGMQASGATVIEAGTVPTPVVALLTKQDDTADSGIVITASHNPASDNGIKVLEASGDKLSDGEEVKIEEIFFGDWEQEETSAVEPAAPIDNVAQLYCASLRELIGSEDLSSYQICIDSAAGAAYGFANEVADILGTQLVDLGPAPTGKNINADCGALYPEKLAEKMRENSSDLGAAFDGDADRIVLVDDAGNIWDGDRIVSMLATHLKSQDDLPNSTVVLTEYSNLGAVRHLEQNGIKVEKVDNGDKEVLRRCRETGATLGGETSGHIIFTPWLSSSDGIMVAFLALSIMKRTGKKLSELWPSYENLPSKQWGIDVRKKLPLEEIQGWEDALREQTESLGGEGRIFVRYSGTENKLRILVEAVDAAKMEQVGTALSNIIRKEIGQ
ncbi:MAG: phosphoglucosamine mutase [Candidatus Saccharimonadales bacterium]